jgi:prepilin-type N-terminal cleavage/methylation domain-containing protein
MTLADFTQLRPGLSSVPRLRSRRGFSILELTVVLILVGIVTAISTGRISAMRAQQQVTRSASVIQTEMEKAFAIAGRNRAPIHILWNPTTMVLSVTNRAETLEYGRTSLRQNFGLKPGDVTVTRDSTEVYPNGFANDTLSITITTKHGSTTYTKRIRMSRAGLVKVI